MTTKTLTALLMTTFLVPSLAFAEGDRSSVYNGNVPEKAEEKQTVRKKFAQRKDETNLALQEINSLVAHLMCADETDDNERAVAQALYKFFMAKNKSEEHRNRHAATMLEGTNTQKFTLTPPSFSTITAMPSFGHYSALKAKAANSIASDEKELESATQRLTGLNKQDLEFAKKQEQLESAKKAAKNAVDAVKAAIQQAQKALPEQKATVDMLAETVRNQQSELDNFQGSAAKKEALQADLDELRQTLNLEEKKCESLRVSSQGFNDQLAAYQTLNRTEIALENLLETMQQHNKAKKEVEDNIQTLRINMIEKSAGKQKLQDEADLYALVKYLTYWNLESILKQNIKSDSLKTISSIASQKFAEMGKTEELNTVLNVCKGSFYEVLQLATKNIGSIHVGAYKTVMNNAFKATVEIVPQVLKDFKTPSEMFSNMLTNGFYTKVWERVKALSTPDDFDQSTRVLDVTLRAMSEIISPLLEKKATTPTSIMATLTTAQFYQQSGLKDLEVENFVMTRKNKWKNKLSTGSNTLCHRLALDSMVFNPSYTSQKSAEGICWDTLKTVQEENQQALPRTVWSTELKQLTNVYGAALNTYKDMAVQMRVAPIVAFVEKKAASTPKQKKHGEDRTENTLAMKALVKYVSYAGMFHALRYDEKDNVLPPLGIASTHRLDQVMAAKAVKWGTRLQKYKKFMQEHALQTFMFDPKEFPPYVGATYEESQDSEVVAKQ